MQTETILIVGKKGTGKTSWAREFIKDKSRVIVAEAGFDEFGVTYTTEFPAYIDQLRRGFFRVSYTPRSYEWAALLQSAIDSGAADGPLWLVLEEADRIPRTLLEYEEVMIRGRHYGINLIAMTTRAANLPPDYRSQATRVIAFRQHEPRDIDYLRDIIGDKALDLPMLKKHNHVDWSESDAWSTSEIENT